MVKYLKGWRIQILLTILVLITCFMYFKNVPTSSSWWHREEKLSGSYKIGKIDLWLNGLQNHSVPVNINATAPTRFFAEGSDRDENFDTTVKAYEINGSNYGDIDVKVDISIIDSGNESNNYLYYIFVPANTTDSNFVNKNYMDYLDSVFSGKPIATSAERKAAMNEINQSVLANNMGIYVAKNAVDQKLFCMLVWSEYDNFVLSTPGQYISSAYPLTINAYSYQIYYTNPPQ